MCNSMVRGDVSSSGAYPADRSHLAESLDDEGLLALLAYEESHGNRAPVMQALAERLAAVRSGTEPKGPLGDNLPSTAGK